MNREIKFSAWDNNAKQFVKVMKIAWMPGLKMQAWDASGRELHDFQLLQFTGLKDKNGEEIYEGDIIQTHPDIHLGEGYKAEIIWRECGFWMDGKSEGMCTLGLGYPKGIAKGVEVIGNIYENPELLKN